MNPKSVGLVALAVAVSTICLSLDFAPPRASGEVTPAVVTTRAHEVVSVAVAMDLVIRSRSALPPQRAGRLVASARCVATGHSDTPADGSRGFPARRPFPA